LIDEANKIKGWAFTFLEMMRFAIRVDKIVKEVVRFFIDGRIKKNKDSLNGLVVMKMM
jgi:hypothetical protein